MLNIYNIVPDNYYQYTIGLLGHDPQLQHHVTMLNSVANIENLCHI